MLVTYKMGASCTSITIFLFDPIVPHFTYSQISQLLLDLLFGKSDSLGGYFRLFLGGGVASLTGAVNGSFDCSGERHRVGGKEDDCLGGCNDLERRKRKSIERKQAR